MATTTNYGWTTPDNTALVKDGASAIRTLGSSADTTVKNLSPGTTAGDIDYYTAATTKARVGIGTSGQALTVVAGVPSWAASARSTLTTTGDSLYASAANTLARLGIGTTGQVLTVAAGLPSWATAPSAIPANGTATVATLETTTSTSYTALTTAGPAVTLTTGTKALVIITADMRVGTSNAISTMSYGVSGATTITVGDTTALTFKQTGTDTSQSIRASCASVPTLTAGSNVFTALYKTGSGTASFFNRDMFVINLA
jgi:hypothetical protein